MTSDGMRETKISMAELQRLMRDPDVPDAELKKYFVIVEQLSRPFAPRVIPNPETVDVSAPETALEGAFLANVGNGLLRIRRQNEFKRRMADADNRPVIVSEGDSWFHFPIFLDDTIKHLFNTYNVWTVAAAGDTLDNMVIGNAEFMRALREHRGRIQAFLFSAGGNDVLGEDASGRSILASMINEFQEGKDDAAWYVESRGVSEKLAFVEDVYRRMITAVTQEFPNLPILIHGYDYAIPGGGAGDTRHPKWAAQDKWLGGPLTRERNIKSHKLQRDIIRLLIDELNRRLMRLAGGNHGGMFTNVWMVDVRNTLRTVADWADELHPTSSGYGLVAGKFDEVLKQAIAGRDAKELGRAAAAPAQTEAFAKRPPERVLRPMSKPRPPRDAFEAEVVEAAAPKAMRSRGGHGAACEPSRSMQFLAAKGKAPPLRRRSAPGGLESIIGRDDRVRILDTDLAPWRMICALELRSPTGAGAIGTGWLVGPRTIVTAGHCVHSQFFFGGWASTIDISPGRNGSSLPYGTVSSTRFSSVDRWIEQEDPDFDIGCIHLDRPIADVGWFSFASLSATELEGYLVNVSGYPGDRGSGTEQYHHVNRVLSVSDRRVYYDVDTFGGQSGAPVWIHEKEDGPPIVIGIHAYGVGGSRAGLTANSAPRIIPAVFEQISAWIDQDGGLNAD